MCGFSHHTHCCVESTDSVSDLHCRRAGWLNNTVSAQIYADHLVRDSLFWSRQDKRGNWIYSNDPRLMSKSAMSHLKLHFHAWQMSRLLSTGETRTISAKPLTRTAWNSRLRVSHICLRLATKVSSKLPWIISNICVPDSVLSSQRPSDGGINIFLDTYVRKKTLLGFLHQLVLVHVPECLPAPQIIMWKLLHPMWPSLGRWVFWTWKRTLS